MKPKLLFVYDMPVWKEKFWMDGLWAALNFLEEDFEIERANIQKPDAVIEDNENFADWDFVLGWGGFNSSVDKVLQQHNTKKGLCIGGNAFPARNGYDILFYETKWVRDHLQLNMVTDKMVHAFGVNTDIFNKIDIPTPIVWDYIGVGAMANWKRWEKMTEKHGMKLVVGEYQRGNPEESGSITTQLLKNNVMVSPMVNPYDLANLYHWSRTLYIPADVNGGGERAILEARACGLEVEVEDDNPKLQELLKTTIYDHIYYSKQLKEGILSVL